MTMRGKVNVYVCASCKYETVTIDAADGVTPMFINCKRPDRKCTEMASSSFYCVDQTLTPTHEWYKPEKAEFQGLNEATQDHVTRGGLLIRPHRRMPGPATMAPKIRRKW